MESSPQQHPCHSRGGVEATTKIIKIKKGKKQDIYKNPIIFIHYITRKWAKLIDLGFFLPSNNIRISLGN